MAQHPGSSNPCNSDSKLHRLILKIPLVLGHRALHGPAQPVAPRLPIMKMQLAPTMEIQLVATMEIQLAATMEIQTAT